MIKSKVTGFIDFGNGPIEVQGEAETVSPPINEEIMEQTRNLSENIKKMQQQTNIILELPMPAWATEIRDTVDRVLMGGCIPMGPVVESTLAEKSEERQ